MAWRIRYSFNVDWVAPGMGPIGSPQVTPGASNNQTFGGVDNPAASNLNVAGAATVTIGGTSYSNVINAADITTLTNGMAADVSTQLNANLARIQGFIAGQG